MGAHVLRLDANEAVVRVMYISDHIPPDRAWYAVSLGRGWLRPLLLNWAPDDATRKKILVDNPAELYNFR